MARICDGQASRESMRLAMRRVSTLVLPEPAPATMSSAWPRYSTASRWRGLRPASRGDSWGAAGSRMKVMSGLDSTGRHRLRSGAQLGPGRQPEVGLIAEDAVDARAHDGGELEHPIAEGRGI